MSQSDILEIVSIVEDLSPMTFIWKTDLFPDIFVLSIC